MNSETKPMFDERRSNELSRFMAMDDERQFQFLQSKSDKVTRDNFQEKRVKYFETRKAQISSSINEIERYEFLDFDTSDEEQVRVKKETPYTFMGLEGKRQADEFKPGPRTELAEKHLINRFGKNYKEFFSVELHDKPLKMMEVGKGLIDPDYRNSEHWSSLEALVYMDDDERWEVAKAHFQLDDKVKYQTQGASFKAGPGWSVVPPKFAERDWSPSEKREQVEKYKRDVASRDGMIQLALMSDYFDDSEKAIAMDIAADDDVREHYNVLKGMDSNRLAMLGHMVRVYRGEVGAVGNVLSDYTNAADWKEKGLAVFGGIRDLGRSIGEQATGDVLDIYNGLESFGLKDNGLYQFGKLFLNIVYDDAVDSSHDEQIEEAVENNLVNQMRGQISVPFGRDVGWLEYSVKGVASSLPALLAMSNPLTSGLWFSTARKRLKDEMIANGADVESANFYATAGAGLSMLVERAQFGGYSKAFKEGWKSKLVASILHFTKDTVSESVEEGIQYGVEEFCKQMAVGEDFDTAAFTELVKGSWNQTVDSLGTCGIMTFGSRSIGSAGAVISHAEKVNMKHALMPLHNEANGLDPDSGVALDNGEIEDIEIDALDADNQVIRDVLTGESFTFEGEMYDVIEAAHKAAKKPESQWSRAEQLAVIRGNMPKSLEKMSSAGRADVLRAIDSVLSGDQKSEADTQMSESNKQPELFDESEMEQKRATTLDKKAENSSFVGKAFKVVKDLIPSSKTKPTLLKFKGSDNTQKQDVVIEAFNKLPDSVAMPNGETVLIHNPENGSLAKRALHLAAGKGKNRVVNYRAKWISNIAETAANPDAVLKTGTENKFVVKKYDTGYHVLVIGKGGKLIDQDFRLISQFLDKNAGGKRGNAEVEWLNNDKALVSQSPTEGKSPSFESPVSQALPEARSASSDPVDPNSPRRRDGNQSSLGTPSASDSNIDGKSKKSSKPLSPRKANEEFLPNFKPTSAEGKTMLVGYADFVNRTKGMNEEHGDNGVINKTRNLLKSVNRGRKNLFSSVRSWLRSDMPLLLDRLQYADSNRQVYHKSYTHIIDRFSKAFRALQSDDAVNVSKHVFNGGDLKDILQYLKADKDTVDALYDAYKEVREVLDHAHKIYKRLGFGVKYQKNYIPRTFRNFGRYEQFARAELGTEVVDAAYSAWKKVTKDKDEKLNELTKRSIIEELFKKNSPKSNKFQIRGPRTFEVHDGNLQDYLPVDVSLMKYFHELADNMTIINMFGEDYVSAILTGNQELIDVEKELMKFDNIDAWLELKYTNYRKLDGKDKANVVKALQYMFGNISKSRVEKTLQKLNYGLGMNSFTSSISQLGDYANSAFDIGVIDTAVGVIRHFNKEYRIEQEDIGHGEISGEDVKANKRLKDIEKEERKARMEDQNVFENCAEIFQDVALWSTFIKYTDGWVKQHYLTGLVEHLRKDIAKGKLKVTDAMFSHLGDTELAKKVYAVLKSDNAKEVLNLAQDSELAANWAKFDLEIKALKAEIAYIDVDMGRQEFAISESKRFDPQSVPELNQGLRELESRKAKAQQSLDELLEQKGDSEVELSYALTKVLNFRYVQTFPTDAKLDKSLNYFNLTINDTLDISSALRLGLYPFKSPVLKMFDIMRRSVVDNWVKAARTNNSYLRGMYLRRGTGNLLKYAGYFAVFNGVSDFIKDVLLDRPIGDEDEYLVENLIKMIGMNRWQVMQMTRNKDGFASGLVNMFTPPVVNKSYEMSQMVYAAATDKEKMLENRVRKLWNLVPAVGKPIYWISPDGWGGRDYSEKDEEKRWHYGGSR